jgi:hypothetical protein
LSLSRTWSDNTAFQLQPSNYRSFTVSGGIAYRRPAFGEVSLYGQYGETSFPNRFILVGAGLLQDGYKSYSTGLRYNHSVGARIEATANIGYITVHPEIASVARYDGVTYGAQVSFRATSRVRLRLKFDRDINPSNRPDTTFAVDNTYSVEGDYAIGSRIKLNLGLSDRTSRYRGANLVPGIDLANDRNWAVYGSIRLSVGRRLGLELNARHEDRNANVTAFSYTDTRVGASAIASF